MRNLNSMLDSSGADWTLSGCRDINNAGQIVGGGTHNGQSRRAFLLTPQLVTTIVDDDPDTLFVTEFVPTSTGFRARFSRDLDSSVLNLYDSAAQLLGPSDAVLVGASVGVVRGSLIVSGDNRQVTFVCTGGPLVPDTYTVTLRSADNGFREPSGDLLAAMPTAPSGTTTPRPLPW
jgi:hypothetical protein